MGNDTFTWNGSLNGAADAGNYSLTNPSISVPVTVTPIVAPTITVTPYSVAYNGVAQTATGVATGLNGLDMSDDFDFSNTVHTDAGTYNDTWVFNPQTINGVANPHNNANYQTSAVTTIVDSIVQATSSDRSLSTSVTYGPELSATLVAGSLVYSNGVPVPGTFTYSTAVGTQLQVTGSPYSESVVFTPDHDYSDDYATVNTVAAVTVNPAQITPSVNGSTSFSIAYGTEPMVIPTSIVGPTYDNLGTLGFSAVIQGTTNPWVMSNGTDVDAGVYTLTPTLTVPAAFAADYDVLPGTPITLTIGKINPVSFTVPNLSGTYTGSQVNATATVIGLHGLSLDTTGVVFYYYSGPGYSQGGTTTAPTNAGNYKVDAVYPGSTNYSPYGSGPVFFTIAQAPMTIATTPTGGLMIDGYVGNENATSLGLNPTVSLQYGSSGDGWSDPNQYVVPVGDANTPGTQLGIKALLVNYSPQFYSAAQQGTGTTGHGGSPVTPPSLGFSSGGGLTYTGGGNNGTDQSSGGITFPDTGNDSGLVLDKKTGKFVLRVKNTTISI